MPIGKHRAVIVVSLVLTLIRNGETWSFPYASQIGDHAIQTGTGATGIVVAHVTTGTGPVDRYRYRYYTNAADCEKLIWTSRSWDKQYCFFWSQFRWIYTFATNYAVIYNSK